MITIVASTNRNNSYTLKLAKYYQRELTSCGVESTILDLSILPCNFTHAHLQGDKPVEFNQIQTLINQTEKFIFIIPEYNGSYPGILKVLIDACAFPNSFQDKKACLVGLSSGKYGNIRGIEHFSGVCAYLNINVLSLRLHIPNIKNEFNKNDELIQADTLKFTKQQIEKFIKF